MWFNRQSTPTSIWLPSLVVGAAMLLPLAYLFLRGAESGGDAVDLLLRWRTLKILGRSLLLTALVITISSVIALPVAWITVRTDIPFKRFWLLVTAMPLVLPSYVGAFVVVTALGPKGLLQQILSDMFGVDRLPDIYGLPGATLTLSLFSYPYVLLTLRAVMRNLDPSIEEAARTLGHGSWKIFISVIIPQIIPAITSGALLVGLYTLSDFGAVSLMGYETFTFAIYQQYQSVFDRSMASVLSLVLVIIAFALVFLEGKSQTGTKLYRSGIGVQRPIGIRPLGRWKLIAFGFCSGVTLFAFVLPITVLAYLVIRTLESEHTLVLSWLSVWNSVYVSGLAAMIVCCSVIPVSLLVVRHPGIFAKTIEGMSFIGYALPGLVVAVSLVFFGANYAISLYQTIWLLLFAYAVLFFPTGLVILRSVLRQIRPNIEDAALGLGRTPREVFFIITVPLLRSGVLMTFFLVFLLTFKELPATLILSPLDFQTLATSIWSASSEALLGQAAVASIILILISCVPMSFFVLKEGRELSSAVKG